jgi:pimeloyl-ACP methyl ester carboxylesterase
MDLHPLARRAVIRSTRPVADRIFSKRISDEEFVWASRLAMRYDPTLFERQLRALRKPTLVAWATQDPAVQPEVSLETLGCAVDAESLRIEAKTHNLQATHAVELADTLLEWIASTSDSAAVSR